MQLFGVLVAMGILSGRYVAILRARALKVPEADIKRSIDWVLLMSFAMAHWVEVLLYHPHWLETKGWIILLKFWDGISSYGGFLGSVIGLLIATRGAAKGVRAAHLDCLMQGVVVGWVFGRLGCTVALDHPGAITDSPLGFRFHDGQIRHNLGFYELLLTLFVFLPLSYWLHRRYPRALLQASVVGLTYAVLRFGLDFFRAPDAENGDVRYLGFTPAQYFSVALATYGVVTLAQRWRVKGLKKRR